MIFIIKYYFNEGAKRTGTAAFTEQISGDKNYVIKWAENKLKNSNFQCYDIIQK